MCTFNSPRFRSWTFYPDPAEEEPATPENEEDSAGSSQTADEEPEGLLESIRHLHV